MHDAPSPARLLSLFDPMVNYSFLHLAVGSYLPYATPFAGVNSDSLQRPDADPLISPAVASDDILRLFPPTYIIVGSQDPLADDAGMMAVKLSRVRG